MGAGIAREIQIGEAMAMAALAPPPVRQLRFHKVEEEVCFGGGSGMHDVKLEQALWSNLPQELLDVVMLRLPAASQARFRAVCRGWCSRLSSPDFVNRSIPSSCLLFVFEPGPACYGFMQRSDGSVPPPTPALAWPEHVVSLASIPEQFRRWHDGMLRVVTQSGLVCIASQQHWGPGKLCICVVNPVNQTWRELPGLDWQPWSYLLLTELRWQVMVVADKKSFKVIVVTEVVDVVTTFSVYSSATSSWSVTSRELAGAFSSRDKSRHVVCNNVIYALVGRDHPEMVLLDMEDGSELGRLSRLPPVYFVDNVHLGEFQGRVVWVEREQVRGKVGQFVCRIWMLVAGGEQWEQIAVMPDDVLADMKESFAANEPGLPFHYLLKDMKIAGNTIFLNLSAEGQTHVVAYHIVERSWRVILHDGWYVRDFHVLDPRPTLYLKVN